jgi:HSP20 family molecular chaperone IbpA
MWYDLLNYYPYNLVENYTDSFPYYHPYLNNLLNKPNEDDEKYTYILNIPGMTKDNVNITITNNCMTINASNNTSNLERIYTLPNTCDTLNITAKVEHGVLNIYMPKLTQEPTRIINIE